MSIVKVRRIMCIRPIPYIFDGSHTSLTTLILSLLSCLAEND